MLYSLFQYLTRRRDGRSGQHTPSYKLASFRSGESSKKHSKKFRHPLSVPNDTANGSDEQIVHYPPPPKEVYPSGGAEAYSTPVTRQASRYGERDEGKGIQVRTELSVQSSEKAGDGVGVARGFPSQAPPPLPGYPKINV